MAKRPVVKKNKPRFFSVLLTLLLIAAGVFGVYKVRSIMTSGPLSAFLPEGRPSAVEVSNVQADDPEDVTKPADDQAIAAAKAIGEADDSLSPAFLSYIADNCEAKALETVLAAMASKDFDKEVWFTATGSSFYALQARANGDVDKGAAREIESDKDAIELGFAGKINAAQSGTAATAVSADLQKILQGADVFVVNNACAFSADGKTAPYMADAKTAAVYKTLGVDLASIANNRATDYGADALAQTQRALKDNDVLCVGAGENVTEAAKPAAFLVGGRKIAFLGASDILSGRGGRAATASAAGALSLRGNLDAAKNAVKAAKADSDYVFVYIHAGIDDNANWFDGDQDAWSKALIDAGADGVIGAHSNRVQGMEFYKGKLIVYGLGNFWYDGTTRETAVYKLTIDKDGKFTHTLIPCKQTASNVSLCTADADKSSVYSRVEKFCGNVVKVSSDGTITNNRR